MWNGCPLVPSVLHTSMGIPIDLTGQRFNHLLVLRHVPRPPTARHRRLMWECLCDCGNTTIVVGKLLRSGVTKSCGCLRLEATRRSRRKAPGHSGMVELWHAYKKGAEARGIEFHLSQEKFKELTSSPCHYCGNPPRVARWMRGKKMTEEGKQHSTYVSNGVDRVDSSVGYIEENCVPCCKFCNYAKRALPVDVFLTWARQLVAYQDRKMALSGA